jgi:large repetitive protein
MKQKILFIMVVFMIAASTLASPQTSYIAGKFKAGLVLEGEQKKEIRSNENIVFSDSLFIDLNMDGRPDIVSRNEGLHVKFQVADSSYTSLILSNDNNKIAVFDINGDSLPDLLQNTGFSGITAYINTGMKTLTTDMISMSEDGEAYFTYNNYSDSLQIRYYPAIDDQNIAIVNDEQGLRIIPKANWHGSAILSIAYAWQDLQDTVYCPIIVLPVNDAPTINAQPTPLFVQEDGELIIYKDSLLKIVTDVDTADVLMIMSFENDSMIYHPEENWNGEDSLIFTVSDGQENITLIQHITVEAVNDAPRWSPIAALEFPEDELYRLPLSWFSEHADDIETPDSLLKFHVYSGSNVSISAEGGSITLMPEENWFGEDMIMLIVSDGELRDTAFWSVTVLPVNDAPVLADLPDTLFNEDETLIINRAQLEKFAFDIETPDDKLKWQIRRFGKIRAHYNGARIRLTSSQDWYGLDSLELTVSDGELSDSKVWRFHVLPVNDAPRFGKVPTTRSFLEDETLHIKKSELYSMVSDAETRASDLTWSMIAQPEIHIVDNKDKYSFYADKNWFGNSMVKMIVSDGEYADTLNYTLRVLSVNDKPKMQDIPLKQWNEDDTLAIDRSYLESLASDVEIKANEMMWSFIPDAHVKIKERLKAITLVPDPDWNGDAQIGVVVNDGGLRDTGYMEIRILPVNDPPRWNPLPDTSIAEDGSMYLPLSYIRQFISDPDKGDEIKLEYKVGDNFYVDEKNDTLQIMPVADWFGKESFEFTASDGKKKVKKTWTIQVFAVNDAPYFTMGLPDSISFKANSSDTLLFEDIVYDIDNRLDDLVWEITPGRIVRYMINDDIGGIIFYTENYKFGEDAVSIRVTDGHDMIVYYLPIFVKEVDRFLMANPEKLELLPNTPNPFKDFTDIRYSLPVGAQINIKIYDLLGKEIIELANEYQDAQNYSIRWWGDSESGMPVPSGVYLCRMVAIVDGEPVILMKKMMLVR